MDVVDSMSDMGVASLGVVGDTTVRYWSLGRQTIWVVVFGGFIYGFFSITLAGGPLWVDVLLGSIVVFTGWLLVKIPFLIILRPPGILVIGGLLWRRRIFVEDVQEIELNGGDVYGKLSFIGGSISLSPNIAYRLTDRLCELNPRIKLKVSS